ncbi:hypothetical protein LZZ90_09910 [Flavobacterium sp. SM15]|uniref:hypothetical protein n=1 Tax=Flavobacterium sp. SM15 TaxID=2908005 RepID=UPI001EDB4D65|nr:hypothetical protein [Flavobacterium sp. SM15]MCG2611818.1 hypothetical protein [Flavobacterium sp. SM15]
MRNLLYILIGISILSCKNSSIPENIEWTIVKEEPNKNLSKNNIEIQLNKKVDEKILKEIAQEIREERKDFNNLWIFYHIPEMEPNATWATTHFTPELEVKILGSTEHQDKTTSKVNNIEGTILGKWRSEKSLMGASLILFKNKESKLIMRINFKDGGNMDSEINETKKNDKLRLYDNNGNNEYYILEDNGNLGMYSRDGKFDEAIKIE